MSCVNLTPCFPRCKAGAPPRFSHFACTCRQTIALWTLVLLPGCARSNFNLATQREEYTITSTSREVELGRKIARRVERELPSGTDDRLQERIEAIGTRIASVCDRKDLVYQFRVIGSEDVNAFSLPGGYVFVYDGLIKKTVSDDELAAVIAHEVGHVTARHAVKRYEGALGLQLAQLASLATRQGEALRGISVISQATQLAYARQEELEADRLAVKYMKAAGFDPKAAITFLQTMQAIDREKTTYLPRGVVRPQYGYTHPFIPERLRAVKEALFGVADYLDYLNSPE